ncbi:hypothetical protein ACFQX8_14320 [Klenkia terrae]|uniref:hypothetical protein n=1 Tax=Klenkia terrae TaxID=1052259 RepID=UPI003622EA00
MRRTRLTLAATMVASAAVVGFPTVASAAPAAPAADIPVQLMGINDFHGRISETTGTDSQLLTDPGPDGAYGTADDVTTVVGGSASVATTVQATRAAFLAQGGTEAASLFVGAGDLISASPFDSSVFGDEPTVEVLNAMGLDVSSVGNHEFDRGTEELRRISAATDDEYSDDVEACPATLGGQPFAAGVDGCFPDSTGRTSTAPTTPTSLPTSSTPPPVSRCCLPTRSSTWVAASRWPLSAWSPRPPRRSSPRRASPTSSSSTRPRPSTAGCRCCRPRGSRPSEYSSTKVVRTRAATPWT